jgi:PiT family inorganic phosphate transporter
MVRRALVTIVFLLLTTFFLAYTNGANDNFKGVATLFGSGTTNYKRALAWATATTFAGSIVAVFIGAELVQSFSGKGLVPDGVALDPQFLSAVGFGAALTVLAATRFGFPISTTHAMTGALLGAGLVATGGDVSWSKLGGAFFLPLLVSPVLAVVLAVPRSRSAKSRRSFASIPARSSA